MQLQRTFEFITPLVRPALAGQAQPAIEARSVSKIFKLYRNKVERVADALGFGTMAYGRSPPPQFPAVTDISFTIGRGEKVGAEGGVVGPHHLDGTGAAHAQPLVHHHFGSKEALWRESMDRLFGDVLPLTRGVGSAPDRRRSVRRRRSDDGGRAVGPPDLPIGTAVGSRSALCWGASVS